MLDLIKPSQGELFIALTIVPLTALWFNPVAAFMILGVLAYVHLAVMAGIYVAALIKCNGDWFDGVDNRRYQLTKDLYRLWRAVLLVGVLMFCTVVWMFTFSLILQSEERSAWSR